MRALDEINTHEVQHGVSLFGKVPSLTSVFLHFIKTNVQRIHSSVFGSFGDCSYIYIYILAPCMVYLHTKLGHKNGVDVGKYSSTMGCIWDMYIIDH